MQPSSINPLSIQHVQRHFHQTRNIAEQSHENNQEKVQEINQEKAEETNQEKTPETNQDAPPPNPICDICRINPTTEHIPDRDYRSGRNFWNKEWASFCDKCYKIYAAGRKTRRQEIADEVATRKRRVQQMLEHIQSMQGTHRMPLDYAKQQLQTAARSTKFFKKPRRQYQKRIRTELRHVLGIERGTCLKDRVDAMDWTLWCLHPHLDIEV